MWLNSLRGGPMPPDKPHAIDVQIEFGPKSIKKLRITIGRSLIVLLITLVAGLQGADLVALLKLLLFRH
jgi:hypothetical protein